MIGEEKKIFKALFHMQKKKLQKMRNGSWCEYRKIISKDCRKINTILLTISITGLKFLIEIQRLRFGWENTIQSYAIYKFI